ncbi:MAG: hydantoinase B/oxoprolinase family protein [Acidobacteriota bacterium]
MAASHGWRIWIDIGGTFTDALGIGPDGILRRAKVLSTGALRGNLERREGPARLRVRQSWDVPPELVRGFSFRILGREPLGIVVEDFDPASSALELSRAPAGPIHPGTPFEVRSPEEAPVLAARLLTRSKPGRPLPAPAMRLATTLATNALLERRGAPTALFITSGFGDLLRIGTQQRPDLFALEVRRPVPLYAAVVEVPERIAADGSVLRALDREVLAAGARRLLQSGIDVAAVCLLHSYRNPVHEQEVRDLLLRRGFRHVSCSSDLSPLIKILPRAETAVVDATLSPVVRDYLGRIGRRLGRGRLHVMTSAGGLVGPLSARPKDMLLSGPAGGVVGAALAGRRSGASRLIAFDMGGTSTDVARFDGEYEYRYEQRIADAHLVAPGMAIETVASGGGSICWFDGERLRVGPRSAGADPGPACYGGGGPLTLTDVDLLLGRLDPDGFEIPIDPRRSSERLDELRRSLAAGTGERARPESILSGFLEIADERMADAIRRVSLRRGYDPSGYALVAFGGAGGQHACSVAARLGMRTIILPRDGSLLSALGLGHATLERFAEEQVLEPLVSARKTLPARFERLARRAARELEAEGAPPGRIKIRRRTAYLRFVGQDSVVEIPFRDGASLLGSFKRRYAVLFGHRPERRAVEVESLRVVASSRGGLPARSRRARRRPAALRPIGRRRCYLGGRFRSVPVFRRDDLPPGASLAGPALVFERHSASLVEPAWRAEVDGAGALVLRLRGDHAPRRRAARRDRPEAVRLELFVNRLESIASEMGDRLQRTAVSTNVRERLDFSCAVLDAAGDLVVNAPHIPVHLGSLGLCVRALARAIPMRPGDSVVTNHPLFGGSHLPDVTVVTPVFTSGGRGPAGRRRARRPELLGYVASRAHHAEIGGSRPGSFPPDARRLVEEGVVIPPTHIVRAGRPRWEAIRRILEEGAYPSRAVPDNLADLRAALAANHAGAVALEALAASLGGPALHGFMAALKRLAERRMRSSLRAIPEGTYRAEEHLDDGSPLRVAVAVADGRARFDFTGSAPQHPGNLNATPAVVRSVVMYVLRLLLREPLPLNDGLLRPIRMRIPRGILNPRFGEDPAEAPAVVGGNVETSQRLVDTLLKALRLAACSQGTMNNVLFGTEGLGYYETICGGCGAGPGFRGADAVHSHMTNTRITDPEVIEHRYPVRVERFALRRGSGGAGRYRGGDGVVRELTFLRPAALSVLSQHRTVGPSGLAGGADGLPGAQRLLRASGETVPLGPIDACDAAPGDRLVVETPGGGGYGPPEGEP